MEKQFYVYIMTNPKHSVLYTGVTSEIQARSCQDKEKLSPGFTSRYGTSYLVYYEELPDSTSAIIREKQIKGGSRKKKLELINKFNPDWKDLYSDL